MLLLRIIPGLLLRAKESFEKHIKRIFKIKPKPIEIKKYTSEK
ncbi:MAG: hypothetical protein ACE5DM_05220 [Candidatus Nanoarchaeia archaeon]